MSRMLVHLGRTVGATLFLLALTALTGEDAQAQTGTVVGVVVDAETGLTLAGATVSVPGTYFAALSNTEGGFSLRGIPAGQHELVTEYIGYGAATESVSVAEDEITRLRIELSTEAIAVEGVTVVGQRRGQASALNRQMTSANITNMVAADQIGRFPDANVGDAMKRIPGVVVMSDQGEARFGLIRGTEPRLNSITVNGERIPSAEAEVREVQLDLIPSDMVSAVPERWILRTTEPPRVARRAR